MNVSRGGSRGMTQRLYHDPARSPHIAMCGLGAAHARARHVTVSDAPRPATAETRHIGNPTAARIGAAAYDISTSRVGELTVSARAPVNFSNSTFGREQILFRALW